MSAGVLKFTFKNVSGKTIIEFCVDDLHGNMTGFDAFTNGLGAVPPGGEISANFGMHNESLRDQSAKTIRVTAVFYDDGSAVGSAETLAQVEDEMLGAALETKRNSDLLAASPDPNIAGLETIAERVRSQPAATDKEAPESLRGIALAGISQTYINEHLSHPSFGLRTGIHRARQMMLGDIGNIKSAHDAAMRGSKAAQHLALEKRPRALSDLAKQYSSLTESHARYIKSIKGTSSEN